jgi:2-polyprenyl-3-methyl-5-hydroxy-6-metoxy-1,4-benzoquinol methylase
MMNAPTYYRYSRKDVTPLLPKYYSRVLEIGCGEGTFRGNLNKECEYWGVEPMESAAKIASGRLDRVLVGTYEEVLNQLPKDYFDLVICNDVIEHMVDHDEFLQSIKQNLTENSCLVGSIPNVRYIGNLFKILFAKDWEYKQDGILDKTHLRFFTEKSLKRTIRENGFVLEEFQGLYPFQAESVSIKEFLRRFVRSFAISLFGQDVKFYQFGIRIRYVASPKEPQINYASDRVGQLSTNS